MKKTHVLVVPVRAGKNQGCAEVCLITSRGKGQWLVPKGWCEQGKTDREVAVEEAYEEAGLHGPLRLLSRNSYLRPVPGRDFRGYKVYLMKVDRELNSWPEQHQRQRKWLPVNPDTLAQHLNCDRLTQLILDGAPAVA